MDCPKGEYFRAMFFFLNFLQVQDWFLLWWKWGEACDYEFYFVEICGYIGVFFWHLGYGVFLQITYLAMTFEYIATILTIIFWDGGLIGYMFLGVVVNLATQW